MAHVNITFPDGSKKSFPESTTSLAIAQGISEGLARNVVGALVNGKAVDANRPIKEDAEIKLLTAKDEAGLEIIRHSAAHLLAHAVQRLYPDAQPTIGPIVENGFYYDFYNLSVKEEDMEKIEAEMKKIIKEKLPVERIEHKDKKEALAKYKANKFKEEMIEGFEEGSSSYKQGDFEDLCRGPHVPHTGMFKDVGIKLDKTSAAYWRADAKRETLTRVYGLCFTTKKELAEFLQLREEAEKRDHRKIGKQLKLFSIHEEAAGMPFFHDNGFHIYKKLMDFMTEEMQKLGYEFLRTPMILSKQLWLQSGHWDHYKENMYFSKIDEHDVAVKPMNCPGHILIYKNDYHSYRELPIKAGEFGVVHRHELSGVLSGLFRVRFFTQDDAHVFCSEDQIKDEIKELIELVHRVYCAFGFEYSVELSTKPDNAMGDDNIWELAEKSLAEAMEESGLKFQINPGDGAFYGPKIDFHVKDAIGRSWQCGTIQLDFSMPEKFDLTYEGSDGQKHRPVMIHRAIYGSFERFLGILIEHYAGKFPMWLSPRQVKVLPIADRHIDYANAVAEELRATGFRVGIDLKAETTNKKVREAQLEQYNYILVVGDREVDEKTVTVRTRDGKVHGAKNVKDLTKELQDEIASRK